MGTPSSVDATVLLEEKERGPPQKEINKKEEKTLTEIENNIEIEKRETPKEDNKSDNSDNNKEPLLNDDEVCLAEVFVDSVKMPVSMSGLNKVKNNQWIDDEAIDAAIYKDVIRNHENERLLVSSVVWNNNFNPQAWNPSNQRIRNRLPTVPYHSNTFTGEPAC